MSALDTFLSTVRPWAPGVPDQTAFQALRGVDFAARSGEFIVILGP